MPLDFPASPTNGQVYGAYVYDSSTTAWRSKGGAVAATYVSDTAPSGAVKGDMWYRSSDGTTYVYYVDADTSQWVEIRSEIATSKVGLVPVTPSSLSVSSGTASVAADGTITVSNAYTFRINGCFTSAFKNYKIIMTAYLGTGADSNFRAMFRSAGAYYNTGYYFGGYYSQPSPAVLSAQVGSNATNFECGIINASIMTAINLDVYNPAVSNTNTMYSLTSSSSAYVESIQGIQSSVVAMDGIEWLASPLYATIRIYGYN